MESKYIADETFETVDFTKSRIEEGEYESCTFKGCNISGFNLSDFKFIDCEFQECDLSNANLSNTSFQDVNFRNCKMLGLQFDRCNAFSFTATYTDCLMNHCTFYQMKLARSIFSNCQLEGVDFTEADLQHAKIIDCNLLNANFENTNLQQADLRGSTKYSINPDINKLKGAMFSLSTIDGLLDKYGIKIERDL